MPFSALHLAVWPRLCLNRHTVAIFKKTDSEHAEHESAQIAQTKGPAVAMFSLSMQVSKGNCIERPKGKSGSPGRQRRL